MGPSKDTGAKEGQQANPRGAGPAAALGLHYMRTAKRCARARQVLPGRVSNPLERLTVI